MRMGGGGVGEFGATSMLSHVISMSSTRRACASQVGAHGSLAMRKSVNQKQLKLQKAAEAMAMSEEGAGSGERVGVVLKWGDC